jgi:hypothetical protein
MTVHHDLTDGAREAPFFRRHGFRHSLRISSGISGSFRTRTVVAA